MEGTTKGRAQLSVRLTKYYWGDRIKKNEMGRARGGAHRVLVEKLDGKRRLGKPRHRRENNIKIYLQDWVVDWNDLVDNRDGWRAFVNVVMNRQAP